MKKNAFWTIGNERGGSASTPSSQALINDITQILTDSIETHGTMRGYQSVSQVVLGLRQGGLWKRLESGRVWGISTTNGTPTGHHFEALGFKVIRVGKRQNEWVTKGEAS